MHYLNTVELLLSALSGLKQTRVPEGKPLSGPVTIKVDESGAVEDTFADVKDIKLAGAAIKFRK